MESKPFISKGVILLLILSVVMVGGVSAATWTVNSGESIQAAIDGASSGDTISIDAGTYEITDQINVNIPLSIVGQGIVTIKANNPFWPSSNSCGCKHIIDIGGNLINPVVISNIIFDSNNQAYGVQVYKSSAVFNNVEMKNSVGAGLTVNGATVTATDLSTSGTILGGL